MKKLTLKRLDIFTPISKEQSIPNEEFDIDTYNSLSENDRQNYLNQYDVINHLQNKVYNPAYYSEESNAGDTAYILNNAHNLNINSTNDSNDRQCTIK